MQTGVFEFPIQFQFVATPSSTSCHSGISKDRSNPRRGCWWWRREKLSFKLKLWIDIGRSINTERAENCIFGSFFVRATTHQGHINKIANMSSSESVAQSVTQVPSLALRDGIKGKICIMTPGRYIVIIIVFLFNGGSLQQQRLKLWLFELPEQ